MTPGGTVSIEDAATFVRSGPGVERRLAVPRDGDRNRFTAAGAFGAITVDDAIALLDLASGAELRRIPLEGMQEIALGLSAAGDLAVTAEVGSGADWLLWAPAGADRFTRVVRGDLFGLVATAAGRIAFATPGGRLAGVRVVVLEPAAEPRVVYRGPPAANDIGALALSPDGHDVAFSTSGCQLVARVDPASSRLTIPPGPCVLSEAGVTIYSPPLDGSNRYRTRIACVTAPAAGCRVSVRLQTFDGHTAGAASYRVRRGAHQLVRVRLDRRGRAAARREPIPALWLRVRVTDPDGRARTVYNSVG